MKRPYGNNPYSVSLTNPTPRVYQDSGVSSSYNHYFNGGNKSQPRRPKEVKRIDMKVRIERGGKVYLVRASGATIEECRELAARKLAAHLDGDLA